MPALTPFRAPSRARLKGVMRSALEYRGPRRARPRSSAAHDRHPVSTLILRLSSETSGEKGNVDHRRPAFWTGTRGQTTAMCNNQDSDSWLKVQLTATRPSMELLPCDSGRLGRALDRPRRSDILMAEATKTTGVPAFVVSFFVACHALQACESRRFRQHHLFTG